MSQGVVRNRSQSDDLERRVTLVDWLMLVLALVSIGLLAYETWWPVTDAQRSLIFRIDQLICGLFFIEFNYRWYRTGWKKTFVYRNWYEILGMIPISEPYIRGFRLFRVIRIVILLARFGAAADRAFGEEFTYRFISKFKRTIVDAIAGTITVAVLDETAVVLAKGTYTKNIANALDAHEGEIDDIIIDKLHEHPRMKRFARLPFFDDIVTAVAESAQEIVVEVLRDERTEALINDMLTENIQQIRDAVRVREEARTRSIRKKKSPQ